MSRPLRITLQSPDGQKYVFAPFNDDTDEDLVGEWAKATGISGSTFVELAMPVLALQKPPENPGESVSNRHEGWTIIFARM